MPLSVDLTDIVTKFQAVDPAQNSVNQNYDAIAKRSGWDNFWGWFISLITFGCCANNSELDRTTRNVVAAANSFFQTPQDAVLGKDLKALQRTFTKLEIIIKDNGGSELAEVQKVAQKVKEMMGPTLIELMIQFDISKADVTEEQKVAARNIMASVFQKTNNAFEWQDYSELQEALIFFKNDPERFTVIAGLAIASSDERRIAIDVVFAGVEWPSEELKKKLLAYSK